MAKRTTVVIHDDLDQSEGARTVKFGLDGKSYEIDLSPKHEEELRKALQKYIDAASPVLSYASPTSTRRKYGTGPVRRDTKHIREWLRENGTEISDRGRIPKADMARYEAANPGR
jgi:Lsr2